VTTAWSIRAATLDDVPAVLALWREADAEVTETDDASAVEALLSRDPEALLVATDDHRIVGSVVAGWDGWRGQLSRLAVHPGARRRGLGTALVRAAEEHLRGLGARRIAAIVVDDHDMALVFWAAAGYDLAPHVRFTKTLQ
jgi:ribosomal protein S18 acetylase RimI-like enzyme